LCEEGQIDINDASLEKLDELSGIGPVKAQAIIDTRPFNSVDNLIDVIGIGNTTLNKIKAQGLACVDKEEEISEEEQEENTQKEEESEDTEETAIAEELQANIKESVIEETQKTTEKEVKIITLNAKNIKSENSKQLDKSKLTIWGFVTFCLLLITLFLLRKDRYKKNEFR
jgi:competence ComEA-like helix-hairpin-helix protein